MAPKMPSASFHEPSKSPLFQDDGAGHDAVSSIARQRSHRSSLEVMVVWSWEFAGILVSATLLIAITMVLRKYNGHKQPEWNYTTLNSLVSWLSTLAAASLLFSVSQVIGQLKWVWIAKRKRLLSDLNTFDWASRGAIGSAALLWLLKGRHFAVFAPLAMVLAIGFHPFVQNLVHYVPHSAEDASGISLLGRASGYNTVGPLIGGDFFRVDPILKANVYSALLNINPAQPWAIPQYTCPTGNCTWDAMASLGIRALCSNITSDLTVKCQDTPTTTNCSISLDSGLSVWYLSTGGSARLMTINTLAGNSNSAAVYKNTTFPVIQYIFAKGSNHNQYIGGGVSTEIGSHTEFIATECALEPVVWMFRASVNLGVYEETVLDEWAALNDFSNPKSPYRISLTPHWKERLTIEGDHTFGIGMEAWGALYAFLEAMFAGYVSAASDTFSFVPSNEVSQYATEDALEAVFYTNFTGSNCPSDDQLACVLRNVAAAMSKTIRDSAFTNNLSYGPSDAVKADAILGHTMTFVPFVSIHWEWFILPVIIWMLGTLSFLGTAWRTHQIQVRTWTNSILPFIFLDVDRDDIASRHEGSHGSETEATSCQQKGIGRNMGDFMLHGCDDSLTEFHCRAKQIQVKFDTHDGQGTMAD